jgi:hypothetical protein
MIHQILRVLRILRILSTLRILRIFCFGIGKDFEAVETPG